MEINEEMADKNAYEMFKKDIESKMSLEDFIVTYDNYQKIKDIFGWFDHHHLVRALKSELYDAEPRPYRASYRRS